MLLLGTRARARRRPRGDPRASTPRSELGADVRELLGLDDVIFDLVDHAQPARRDVHRRRRARARRALRARRSTCPSRRRRTDAAVASDITVVIEAPDRCPRYLGRVARVTMGASPAWMAQRLVKAGMRPISNVVDVTNYVLLERNQPLHAFDLARLGGRGIVVRLADDGEHITTLDGVERDAHRRRPPHLRRRARAAGDRRDHGRVHRRRSPTPPPRSCSSRPTSSAWGSPAASKRLKLRSESSARFERGIDPDAVARNAERAMELLVEVAGARVAPDAVDEYPTPVERPRIRVRTSRVNARARHRRSTPKTCGTRSRPLGIELDQDDARERRRHAGGHRPTFRPDLEREIDLVEEVARRVGFDRIGRTVPDTPRPGRWAHAAPARAPCWSPTRSSGVGLLRGDHAVAGLARRPRARRRAASIGSCAPRTRCAPRSRCCAPRCSPGCCRRSPSTARTACTTSRSSRRAACSSRRLGRRRTPLPGGARAPRGGDGGQRCAAGRWRTTAPVDVYDAVDALRAVARRAARSTTFALEPADVAGFRPGRGARVRRRRRRRRRGR